MSQLMAEWREKKQREDDKLHEQLSTAIASGRVQVFTDPRLLDFQGSPVHLHWDHLLPLTGLMTFALIILLAAGVAVGIVVMTLAVVVYLFGNKHYVAWRLRMRAQSYLLADVVQFQTLWQLGGVALVVKDGNEPPCLAPKGDWRKFIRRNLGEGEAARPEPAPRPVARPVAAPTPPPPPPEPEPEPEAEIIEPPEPPKTHWESIDDQPAHDEVLPGPTGQP
jgi:hypothetical protein